MMSLSQASRRSFLLAALMLMTSAGCNVEKVETSGSTSTSDSGSSTAAASGSGEASGSSGQADVVIDGSSTVLPISEAMAEVLKTSDGMNVIVGKSGTGGGFSKFARGEIDISDASRPIKEKEAAECEKAGIKFLELTVAIDGLTVVVNPQNTWCKSMSVAQLKKLFQPGSTIKTWKDIDPSWPADEIKIYAPDSDSGTYDYFIEAVVGETDGKKMLRSDYEPSSDDSILVDAVSGNKNAIGFFGYAYYVKSKDRLQAVAIAKAEDGSNPVTPTDATIEDGSYSPLSRPLFIYVNKASLKKPKVAAFVKYYMGEGQSLVSKVSYIQIPAAVLAEQNEKLKAALAE